jgi:hypothetical protein
MSQMNVQDYYDHHWQQKGGFLQTDPPIIEKIEIIKKMLPDDVTTIVDIGCGDGAITNSFADKYSVTAVDISSEALKFLDKRINTFVCDASSLPWKDGSFDLVFSSEMIEHLPPTMFDGVIQELKRLPKKYLFISVPNKEELRHRFTWCANCHKDFHIYQHFHSFNVNKIKRLFPEYKVLDVKVCGVPDDPTFGFISLIRNLVVRSYFYIDSMNMPCPHCGNVIQRQHPKFWQKACSKVLNYLEKGLIVLTGKKGHLDWLMVLMERKNGE